MTLQEALDWTDLIVPRHDPFPDDEALVTLAAEVRRLRSELAEIREATDKLINSSKQTL